MKRSKARSQSERLRVPLPTQWALWAGFIFLLAALALGKWIEDLADDLLFSRTIEMAQHYIQFSESERLSLSSYSPVARDFPGFPQPVRAYKVWDEEGRIVSAYDSRLTGNQYGRNPRFEAALQGKPTARLSPLREPENELERIWTQQLLEVYVPLRDSVTGQTVGVVELYLEPSQISGELEQVRRQAWLIAGGTLLSLYAVLLGGTTLLFRGNMPLRDRRFPLTLAQGPPQERQVAAPQLGSPWGLTAREEEVLSLLARGLTNREVAEALFLSENTVKHYISQVLSKQRTRNRLEAALLYRSWLQEARGTRDESAAP